MVELQHEAHDAEHVGVAAHGGRVYGQTALHTLREEVSEIGKSRCQARRREWSYADVSTGLGDHLALFRRRVVCVNELDVRAEQLVAVQHLDAAEFLNLLQRAPRVLRDGQAQAPGVLPFLSVHLRRRVAWT